MFGCRIPPAWLDQFEKMARASGKKPAELARDAFAAYLGYESEGAPDVQPSTTEEVDELSELRQLLERQISRINELESQPSDAGKSTAKGKKSANMPDMATSNQSTKTTAKTTSRVSNKAPSVTADQASSKPPGKISDNPPGKVPAKPSSKAPAKPSGKPPGKTSTPPLSTASKTTKAPASDGAATSRKEKGTTKPSRAQSTTTSTATSRVVTSTKKRPVPNRKTTTRPKTLKSLDLSMYADGLTQHEACELVGINSRNLARQAKDLPPGDFLIAKLKESTGQDWVREDGKKGKYYPYTYKP